MIENALEKKQNERRIFKQNCFCKNNSFNLFQADNNFYFCVIIENFNILLLQAKNSTNCMETFFFESSTLEKKLPSKLMK